MGIKEIFRKIVGVPKNLKTTLILLIEKKNLKKRMNKWMSKWNDSIAWTLESAEVRSHPNSPVFYCEKWGNLPNPSEL